MSAFELWELRNELLALVESCGHLGLDDAGWYGGDGVCDALDAFNAKLEAL